MEQGPYIELVDIHKTFPGVYALKNVSLSIYPGEVHALVGENGAGKSTLIKVIAGYHQPNMGEYLVNGVNAQIRTPQDAIHAGVAVVYQELSIVDSLTVAENIFFGRLPKTAYGRVKWRQLYQDAQAVLDRIGLSMHPKTKVGLLSVAQKQMIEIARCVSMNPKVIIMDEPTSALAPAEIDHILRLIDRLKKEKVGVLYISHKLNEIMQISDRITVLRDGEFVTCLQTANADEAGLIQLMVGRKLNEMFHRESCVGEEIALQVKNLCTDLVKNINFTVRKGEIIGFSGLMGAGRTELAKALIGADRNISGCIDLYGSVVPKNSIVKALKAGIGFLSENRKEEGIFPNLSVKKNTTISSMACCSSLGVIRRAQESGITDNMMKQLRVKTPDQDQLIVNLSGGNQQKVLLARWLAKKNLKVLIVDEPTRGIDVGAKAEIYALLDQLAKDGLAVIMMSSEMQEILGVCDRIFVMKGGKIKKEICAAEATQELLLTSAI